VLENRLPEQNVPLKAKAICPPRLDVIGKKNISLCCPRQETCHEMDIFFKATLNLFFLCVCSWFFKFSSFR
jgi:hypothetical protein